MMRWLRLLPAVLALATAGCSQSEAVPPPAQADPPEKKAQTPEEHITRALKAAQGEDLAGAARHLEQALKVDPKHRQALLSKAVVEQARGGQLAVKDRKGSLPLFLRAAEAMRTLRETYKDLEPQERALLSQVLYNEACVRALQGQPQKALASLAEAYESGLSDLELLDTDEELASVRRLPEFPKLRKELEAKAKARALVHARELLSENKPFPFHFTLTDLKGQKVSLADLRGRVTIVDFWGTWCPPCRQELPHFVALDKKYRDRGLAIVGINYEDGEESEALETVRKFVKEHGIPYPCLIGDEKTQAQVPDFEGFPTTLFLDRDGTVRLKVVGYHPIIELEAIVATLLDEPQ